MFFFLPYKNDRQISLFPAVTYALIAANVCLYIVLLPIHRHTLALMMGFRPLDLSVPNIVSSMFVHGDFLHLIWNMLFLWLFGPNVEDALGHIEFTLLYLGSGFAAALLQVGIVQGFIPDAGLIPVIGASGAIAGILGVFAVRFFKTGIQVFYYLGILFYPLRWGTFTVPAVVGLGIWFAQQFIGGILDVARQGTGGVAYWSHIGGMVFGMALAYGLSMSIEGSKEYLIEDAHSKLENGTADSALLNLSKALRNDPENAEICIELARAYHTANSPDMAIMHFKSSIDILMRKGNRNQAVAYFAELRHDYPQVRLDPRTEYQIARQLLESGCTESALKMLTEISEAYPDAPEAEISLIKAGDLCLNVLGDPESATRFYRSFCEKYPHSQLCAMAENSLKNSQKKNQSP
ncbi:MAG: rhomboid family intramembrane serine protease [Armatimonadota bacterium]